MPASRAIQEELKSLGLSPNKAHSPDHLKKMRAALEAKAAEKPVKQADKPAKNALVELPPPAAEPEAPPVEVQSSEPAAEQVAAEPKKGRFGKKAAKKDEPEEPPVS